MNSLRGRLFVILVLMTTLVWSAAAGWVYLHTQKEVERVLDARLVEAARMVSSLVASGDVTTSADRIAVGTSPRDAAVYARQLSCQIWSLDGGLVGRSDGAPRARLTRGGAGFSETRIGQSTWRVYALDDPRLNVRVMVGDNLQIRRKLVGDMITGLVLPAALGLLALAGLMWTAVERGLAPLRRTAEGLADRSPDDLRPIPFAGAADELRPVITALNGLVARVGQAREREQHLVASAAHELRTPLAGLRTQSQIALATGDGEIRDKALRQIAISVDRTSRLVSQLLEMARHEAKSERPPSRWVDFDTAAAAVAAELNGAAQEGGVTIEAPTTGRQLFINPDLFATVLRNLMDNAVRHSPRGGRVTVTFEPGEASARVIVEDEGRGIPADERDRVRERFFRGRTHVGFGSGLGLSIVDLVVRQAGAELMLGDRQPHGVRAEIVVSSDRVRPPWPASGT